MVIFTDTDIKILISANINSLLMLREKKKDFAKRCGIPQTTMSGYLNAVRPPSIAHLIKIAAACNVTIDWLVNGGSPPIKETISQLPAEEPEPQKDIFEQAMDSVFDIIKKWQADKNGRTLKTATEFNLELSQRFPEMIEWLKKDGGDIKNIT